MFHYLKCHLGNAAKEVGFNLRNSLEDPKIWNEAGELQKGVNSAFSDYVAPLKDFRSRFTTKIEGMNTVDPQKIKTYVNQLGKTGADVSEEVRPKMLKNYITAAENYRNKINDLYATVGQESPLSPISLNTAKESLNDLSNGAKDADAIYSGVIGKIVGKTAGTLGGAIAAHTTGIPGAETVGGLAGGWLTDRLIPTIDNIVGRRLRNVAVPAVLKVLSEGKPTAIGEALEHAGNIQKGATALENGVNSLFSGAKLAGQQFVNDNPDKIKKIKDFVEQGGVTRQIQNTLNQSKQKQAPPDQHFAHGGEVKEPVHNGPNEIQGNKLSEVYPEHDMLMQTAKGRVYGYLNTIRPQTNTQKLAFDAHHVTDAHKKSYDKALGIADKPLSILPKIQKGTVTPEDVKHMTQMWPEVYNQVSKKMTEKLAEAQMKGEKPPYHVRQGMSMFLGAPLDSNMTPASIQAAQSVFMNKAAPSANAPVTKNQKNTSKLGETSKQYMTSSQAAESRQTTARR